MGKSREYRTTAVFRKVKESLSDLYGRESMNLASLLLQDILGIDRIACFSDRIVLLEESQLTRLENALERLDKHEPVQYILGKAHFLGREFLVGRGVLIPRQETEGLAGMVTEQNMNSLPRILDIGCGSGCIAVSLALDIPGADVYAIDISPEAVQVTRKNALRLGAELKIFQFDVFDKLPPWPEFDVIVSNPPYVTDTDKMTMDKRVVAYEPEQALYVSDENPLIYYNRIASISSSTLRPGGKLYFEINESFGIQVRDLLRSMGFEAVRIVPDIHGKVRFVQSSKPHK